MEVINKREDMKELTDRIISFTHTVLDALENVESQKAFSRVYPGLCDVYRRECDSVAIYGLIELYNKELCETLGMFTEFVPSPSSDGTYLITIPKNSFDSASRLDNSFKGEALKRRIHFMRFMLTKLREVEAFLDGREHDVQKEVLDWLEAEMKRR